MRRMIAVLTAAVLAAVLAAELSAQDGVGVVSHVKVLSDKVEDVSSMEAWKRSFIRDDMTGEQKAIALWQSIVKFRHVDSPPQEFLQNEADVHDPIKIFNVYGYGMCCCASACDEALARHIGMEARGWTIPGHSISEIRYDGAWHHMDSERIYYFRKADGTIASVEDIVAAVTAWGREHPDVVKDDASLKQFMRNEGWKKGPALLGASEFFSANGWDPTGGHGWNTVMSLFAKKIGEYEYGYSQGYQVNVQLRPGERLVRNWSHKGLHVNMEHRGGPSCMKSRAEMKYQEKLGDLAPGRVGNGTLEYTVPVKDASLRLSALTYENLASVGGGLRLAEAAQAGVLVIRMPSSYVYLSGEATLKAVVGAGGALTVHYSDNNGLDWKEIAKVEKSGEEKIDLKPFCFRRYDYRLKFEMTGAGTGLDALRITHDVQHSQAPLPALGEGPNTITFSAGPQEGTISIEGNTDPSVKGKQRLATDFHPEMEGVKEKFFGLDGGRGKVTFPIETPGDMTRLRFGAYYRARDARDGWDLEVSFDDGRTFRDAGKLKGPFRGNSKYVTVDGVPAGTRKALVRFSGQQRNTTCIFDFRIDADYVEPHGGFRPVKVTYVWTEDGVEKRNVHVAKSPNETYTITCEKKPLMKGLIVELAE